MRKVLVIDTSILCVWLRVPNMIKAGPDDDPWDFDRIDAKVKDEISTKSTLVLPLATIIETGNHISKLPHSRKDSAESLAAIIRKAAEARTPWAAFSEQSSLWSGEGLKELADRWPNLAAKKLSIGDATIMDVADYYSQAGFEVEILTADSGLKAYQPAPAPELPRRRMRG